MLENFLRDQNNWWFGHLHELAARGRGEDYDYNSLLEKVFNVTVQESDRYWRETIRMEDQFGFHPQIHFGLPEGHVVSIIYFGNPRYDVQYRYGTPTGESYLLAVEGGHDVLPGLRWAEIMAISSSLPHIANLALLSLLPAAHVSAAEKTEAESEIGRALSELGFHSSHTKLLVNLLVEGLRFNVDWFFDEKYGWITNANTCWRCPNRNESGLTNKPPDFFSALKNFTGFLKLNEES